LDIVSSSGGVARRARRGTRHPCQPWQLGRGL